MDELLLTFTEPLLNWFDQHGRKDLPWQTPKTPYRVFVSEIMLQQTQVKTVLPYFARFMQRFPLLQDLALAPLDEVLAYWAGLGYYSRGRNLHKTAWLIHHHHQGIFPQDALTLQQFPGIGPSTAAAIASLAFNAPVAILDGNVKRVLSRYFMINDPTAKKRLQALSEACMSKTRCADYTQAIMDLGALCCRPKQPDCLHCPLRPTCLAYQNDCVALYPQKRAAQPKPVKEQSFLILYRLGHDRTSPEIYLEKRPEKGIWGGLWCLPTHSPINNINAEACFPFKTINHTFTHFHLKMQIIILFHPVQRHMKLNAEHATSTWLAINQHREHIALPKPIMQLLQDDRLSNKLLTLLKAHKPQ